MNAREKDTKKRILEVATEIFANNGFAGTSIREIATRADVNLAAINYHFKNKELLYQQVFMLNFQWMENEIKNIGSDESLDSREFAWQVYSFFVENGNALLNVFKLFLSGNVELPFDEEDPDSFGPPGQSIFIEKFQQDLGSGIPIAGYRWATKMIFSDLVHWGLSMNSPCLKEKIHKVSHFQPEEKKRSIYFLVEAILNYLETHKKNWE